jgi:hypothetical protein
MGGGRDGGSGGGTTLVGGGGPSTGGGTGGVGGGNAGVGGGNTGGGGGTAAGGGAAGGAAAATTIAAARRAMFPANVDLQDVVVTAIGFSAPSASPNNCPGATNAGVTANFWVADRNSPENGIWVSKFRCDPPADYAPALGDVLDIRGYVGFNSPFADRSEPSRVVLKSQFDFIQGTKPPACELTATPRCQPLQISKKGTMAPLAPSMQMMAFGNAMGGTVRANNMLVGARVRVAGPLTITNANPSALNSLPLGPGARYDGFELSNGMLVSNFRTFDDRLRDGGLLTRCDYRRQFLDGGMPTFAAVSGIWDTYAIAPCADGGSANGCFQLRAFVPGTDAGTTNVLYPTECSDFEL